MDARKIIISTCIFLILVNFVSFTYQLQRTTLQNYDDGQGKASLAPTPAGMTEKYMETNTGFPGSTHWPQGPPKTTTKFVSSTFTLNMDTAGSLHTTESIEKDQATPALFTPDSYREQTVFKPMETPTYRYTEVPLKSMTLSATTVSLTSASETTNVLVPSEYNGLPKGTEHTKETKQMSTYNVVPPRVTDPVLTTDGDKTHIGEKAFGPTIATPTATKISPTISTINHSTVPSSTRSDFLQQDSIKTVDVSNETRGLTELSDMTPSPAGALGVTQGPMNVSQRPPSEVLPGPPGVPLSEEEFGPPGFTNFSQGQTGPPGYGDDGNGDYHYYYGNYHDYFEHYYWFDNLLFNETFTAIHFIKTICPNSATVCGSLFPEQEMQLAPYSCCLPCDCSDDCFVVGNCCLDKERPMNALLQQTPKSARNESCILPVFGYNRSQDHLASSRQSYLMVSQCPSGDQRSHLVKMCEDPVNENLKSISDIFPVYSILRSVSFANSFCATCHNETALLLFWGPVILGCSEIRNVYELLTDARNLTSFLQTVSERKCFLEWKPLDEAGKKCFKPGAYISDCVDDGVEKYNNSIRALCQNENLTVLFKSGEYVFKNVFCYGCSPFGKYIANCNAHDYVIPTEKFESELNVPVLNELFSWNQSNNASRQEPDCEPGFAYNASLSICLTLACAPTKVNMSGKCIPILEKMWNVGLDYRIQYKFQVGNTSGRPVVSVFEGNTVNTVLGNKSSSATFRICRTEMQMKASFADYMITYVSHVSLAIGDPINPEDEFLKFKMNVRSAPVVASLDNFGYHPLPLDDYGTITFQDFVTDKSCPGSIAMVDLQFCDAVILPVEPDQITDKKTLVIRGITLAPFEYLRRPKMQKTYVQICRNVFFAKMDRLNTGNKILEKMGGSNTVNKAGGRFQLSNTYLVVLIIITYTLV